MTADAGNIRSTRRYSRSALAPASLAVALLVVISCSRRTTESEENNPFFIRGRRLREQSLYEDAALAFENCLRVTPRAASAHLQLGMIYEDHLDDEVAALYHYRAFLRKRPEHENATVAEASAQRVMERLIKRHAGVLSPEAAVRPPDQPDETDLAIQRLQTEKEFLLSRLGDMNRTVQDLERRLAERRRENGASRSAGFASANRGEAPASVADESARLPRNGDRYHVVEKGDTLSGISRKYFGTAGYWPLLLRINQDVIQANADIYPGMRLRIPRRETLDRMKDHGS